MKRILIPLLVNLALSGCYIGRSAERVELAVAPRGATVQLQTLRGAVNGELLEVQDTALLVLTQQRVTLVPYRIIRRGDVELLREVTSAGRQPSAARRQRLSRISRFPHGIDPDTRRALLAAYDQVEIEVVR